MAKDFNYTLIELARTAETRTNKVIDELQQAATDTRLNYDAQQADLNGPIAPLTEQETAGSARGRGPPDTCA